MTDAVVHRSCKERKALVSKLSVKRKCVKKKKGILSSGYSNQDPVILVDQIEILIGFSYASKCFFSRIILIS